MSKRRREIVVLRSLTGSDLGIFAAHRASATSKQRAININSQVAARLLSPAVYRAGGTMLDCICTLGDFHERSARHFGKVHKNWRLGGTKIEGQVFANIDSVDFVLIRSVEGNDGTAPVSITFVARAIDDRAHAHLVSVVTDRLRQSMTVYEDGEPGFAEVAALCPAPPEPAHASAPHRPPPSSPPSTPVPPMPDRAKAPAKPRTIREKLRSPHILEQMLKVSGDLSAPAQLRFMDTVEQLASQLRTVLLRTGKIVKIEKDHAALWKRVAGKQIGFVDGGMANLSMLGSAPVAVRVGGYLVTPGDRSADREQFITLKKLISELYVSPSGGVYDGTFPDLGALRDAARISIEAAGGVRIVGEFPKVSYLFLHGALVNPVSRYTDVMRDGKVRYTFPNFSPDALTELLSAKEASRAGKEANFISVYLRQLELLQSSETIVCGVVERESYTASVLRQVINELDDEIIRPLLPLPPAEWKAWFRASIDPATEDDDAEGQRITDPLLFRCVLEPGEALLPVRIDRNDMRRAPEAWKDWIVNYPAPFVSYVQPSEWTAPVRLEIFDKDRSHFLETASLMLHCSLLLPKYAFPVGLDIVDKFARIPNWMSRPVNTNTAVQALKTALDRGDMKLFDSLRRMMCGSQREWLLRPRIDR